MGGGSDGRRAGRSSGAAAAEDDAPPPPQDAAAPMPAAYRSRGWVSTLGLLVLAVVAVTGVVVQFGKAKGPEQTGQRQQPESVTTQSAKKPDGAAVIQVTPVPVTSTSPANSTSTIVVNAKDAAVVPASPVSSGALSPLTIGVGGSCLAEDMEALKAAVEDASCALIQLTGSRYDIEEEMVVRRPLTIVGNAATLPYLNAGESIRGFRVTSGASLDIRYVRLKQGKGIIRKRAEFNLRRQVQEGQGVPTSTDLFGPDMMIEIRGGSVYFETGSLGGSFTGVFFIQDESTPDAVSDAIQQTLTNTGMRIYGGHVYIAAGRITFNTCLFYDTEVLTALNDRVYVGGDVLILAGEVSFSGCVWIYTTLFGTENGAGFNVAVLGGVITMSYCYFQENTIAAAYNGVGQAFLVAGGVHIVTGCAFALFTALELFTGTGDFTVLNGVLVMTGVSINDFLAVIAAYGAGFDFTVGSGFMIQTGCSLNQWTGPGYTGAAGGYLFVGVGEYISIGSQYSAYSSIAHESGVGGIYWCGGGMLILIGTPTVDIAGIYASELLGEYTGLANGFLVIIGSPTIEISGIEYYTGLGGTTFVGAGAAVLGRSPLIEFIAIVNNHKDWWIQGTCEEFEGDWAKGPLFFVPPSTVCPPPDSRRLALPLPDNETATEPARQKVKLIAWDLEKIRVNPRDDEGKKLLSRFLDDNAFQAVGRMQDTLTSERPRTISSPATVHIQNSVKDYCGVCGTAELTGPGADSCTYESECSDLQTPIGNPGTFIEEGADSEHFLVMMDVEVGLPNRRLDHTAANATEPGESLEQMLVKGLRRALGGSDDRDPTDYLKELAMQVKVYSSEIDTYYHDPLTTAHAALPKIPPSRKALDIATSSKPADVRTYKAVVILNEKASADGLRETLDKEATEETMATAIQSSLKSEGVETEWASVSFDRVLHVPAYNTQAWKQATHPWKADLGGYSVELIDPEAPARPVTNVQFGKAYGLELKRFGSNKAVDVKAVSTTDEAVTKSITTLTTDSRGRAETAIKFDLSTLPPGNYYIKVTEATADASSSSAAYGSTPVLAFSSQAKRRLYGRSMSF